MGRAMIFKQYDAVRIVAIKVPRAQFRDEFNLRRPKVGDVACIVEVYSNPDGYELECSDANGITQWLIAFGPEEIEVESLH